jgi:hypothetical protein
MFGLAILEMQRIVMEIQHRELVPEDSNKASFENILKIVRQ